MTCNDDFSFCNQYLTEGEYVLWKGKPQKGNLLTRYDAYLIPFSIFWCGFAFFWEIGVLSSENPFPFALFGLPFVAIGLYFVFGRFIWKVYSRTKTAYVITNRKIIRKRLGLVDMLDEKNMPPMRVNAFKNGNGTIWFESYDMGYFHRGRSSWEASFCLDNIADVVMVENVIVNMEH